MLSLPDEELETWHQYLDFIEKDKDIDKVVKLFERCLIACGNYPEYWIRYVISMEQNGKIELANSALDRATQVFVKRKPEIHIFAARIKEQNGDIAGSRAAYQLVHSEISPGHLLEAVTKHANMEKRQGHLDPAFTVYEQVISVEKGIRNSKLLPLLYVQYSKLKYLVSGDAKGAKNILVEALAHVKASKPFIENLLSVVSIMPKPTGIAKLEAFIEEFIEDTQNATSIEREEVSMIYIAFLDMCRVDHDPLNEATKKHAKTLNEAANKHAKLFPWSKSEVRKRSL